LLEQAAVSRANKRLNMATRATCRRTSSGPVMIAESDEDGKFVVIENCGRQEEKLGGWTIRRHVDGEQRVVYALDKKFTIKVASQVKIWAKGKKAVTAPRWDLVAEIPSWGVGKVVRTTLNNPAGEEKAVCLWQEV